MDVANDIDTLLINVVKTAVYYVDALKDFDFDAARLELDELKHTFNEIERLHTKEKNRKRVIDLVNELKEKGLNIDFASRSSFFIHDAKNAVETNKKMQHAGGHAAKGNTF